MKKTTQTTKYDSEQLCSKNDPWTYFETLVC